MKGILDRCKSNIFTLILFFLIVICLVGYVQTSSADSNPYPSTQDTEDLNGDGIPDGDGFYEIPCTWFAWKTINEKLNIQLPNWGNARNWADGANGKFPTGDKPLIGSLAVWTDTYYGHVAYVTRVDGNTFWVDEGGRTDLDQTDSHGLAYNQQKVNNSSITFIYCFMLRPEIYNDAFYAYRYFDELGSMTEQQRRSHWCLFGWSEGRSASSVFDVKYYKNKYADLQNAYGSNTLLYFYHYFTSGLDEGRRGSLIFDPQYYASKNQDVSQRYGTNYASVTNHYLNYGLSEFRTGSSEDFSLNYYKANYQDLQNSYGNNPQLYAAHFLSSGKNEGRIANRRLLMTFDANGGRFSSSLESTQTEITAGKELTITIEAPQKAYNIFLGWSKSASGNSTLYQSSEKFTPSGDTTLYAIWQQTNDKDVYFGVDISQHQGYIDWDSVVGNVDFVMIRCGYAENNTSYDDIYWQTNVSACERLGIPYGVYLYSYMENETDALSEADHVIRLLSGHHPSLPVYLDLEDSKVAALGNDQLTQYTNLWCAKVRNAGYTPGVYANYSWWTNRLSGLALDSKYKWMAAWGSGYETAGRNCGIWQYTNSGSVSGISGSVDCNYCWDLNAWSILPPETYIITYNANGGTNAPESHINSGSLSQVIPFREGYDFLGWDVDYNATSAYYQPGDTCVGNINLSLYAIWTRSRIKVCFDSDGGTAIDPVNIYYGEFLESLPETHRSGFEFTGWYDGDALFTVNTIVTRNLKLKAHWKMAQVNVLKLPAALTEIGDEAFSGLDYNTVIIPSGVNAIGKKAFADNKSLNVVIVFSQTVTPASDAFENCPNLTIYGYTDTPIHYYATAKSIPFIAISNGWVLDTDVPAGATVIDEKWTYTETTYSTESSMPGWTQTGSDWQVTETGISKYVDFPAGFSTGHTLYTKYNPANKKSAFESENRKVVLGETSNAGYVYYHWTLEGEWVTNAANAGKALNVYVWDRNGTDSDGYTYTRFNAFEVGSILNPAYGTNTSGNNLDLTGEGIYSTCYHDTYNLAEYVSHWWYIVGIKQQQYIEYELFYVFTRDNESTEEVQAENENYNVTHWVKYEFK